MPDKLQGVERYLLRLQSNAQGLDAANLSAALDLLLKYREERTVAYLEALSEAFDHETVQQATIATLREALKGIEQDRLARAEAYAEAMEALEIAEEAVRRVDAKAFALTTKVGPAELSCVWCVMVPCSGHKVVKLCHGAECPLVFIVNDLSLAVRAALAKLRQRAEEA